jgi:hypothetical protein
MAWERKIMRTVRIRNEQNPGTLAQLVTAISDMGASVGTINLISETTRSVVRDITVYADNAEHMDGCAGAGRHWPAGQHAGDGRQGHVDGNPGWALRYAHLVEHKGRG